MSLTASKRLREERWSFKQFPLAAVAVFMGGAACIDTATGFVTKGAVSTSLQAIGIFAEDKDNSAGAAGDLSVNVKLANEVVGYRFVNGTNADAIASTDIGKFCFFLDDNTVSIVATAHSLAGRILDVSATKGVLVELMDPPPVALVGVPTITSFASSLHTHENAANGGPLKMQSHAGVVFAANDIVIATPGRWQHYIVPATAGNSTISVGNTGSTRGDMIVFTADGTLNAHTVQYRDGVTAISAALTASKRHMAILVFDGTNWVANTTVGP